MNSEEEYYIYHKQQNILDKEENFNNKISYFFANNKFDDDLNYDMWYNFRRFRKRVHKNLETDGLENNDGFIENTRKKNNKFLYK